MSCTCVVGLQWGDEAKGKIVDLLTPQHDFVIRYNGGANAGHTVVKDGTSYKLSLLPTGVLRPEVTSVIGNGVVVYPPRFIEEVEQLRQSGIPVGANLAVSNHAHVIFPYHMEEERLCEQGAIGTIGTTGRGIGPCYSDKFSRRYGIRLGDLLHPDYLRQRLEQIVPHKNRLLAGLASPGIEAKQFDVNGLMTEAQRYAELLRPFIRDTLQLLHDGLASGKRLLFEGAQGSLLDVDHGTYPFVTSSNSSPAGIWSGSGVPARQLTRVVGVIKAYTTRVGGGPFPTELTDVIGDRIRQRGREYGTVTGRPRRCGWFDAVGVRFTAALAGADELALMLLDVLGELETISLCTSYECDGQRMDHFPGDAFVLQRCRPIYETIPGWRTDISGCRRLADLPPAARRYIDRLSELLHLPVRTVSVGPDAEQTIVNH